MRRNLSQVGNPGRASMSDGTKPRSLGAHYFFVFSLKNSKVNLLASESRWLGLRIT